MRRRTILACVGALSAGCLGSPPPQTGGSTPTPADSETSTATATDVCGTKTEPSPVESADETATDGEYRLANLVESTSVDRPSVKYVLEPSAYYSSDAVQRKAERTGEEQVVMDVSTIDDEDVRTAIETAIWSRDWRSNTLPDGLAEIVERIDFFTGVTEDDTHTHVGVTLYRFRPDRPPAVTFNATVIDDTVSTESPGVVAFELANRSQTTHYVSSGTVPPFGMVYAEPTESGDKFLLWRNYEREGCIDFTDDQVTVCSIGVTTELQPCERITRRYEVLPSETSHQPEYTVPPGPGTYRVTDSLGYSQDHGAPESELSLEVQFTLEAL